MRLERNKEWWVARARSEGDVVIGVGFSACAPKPDHERAGMQVVAAEEARIAFGKFVNLMRRRLGFSVEKLADEADLDVSEILVIEDDVHYLPEPRTVNQLAQLFEVPQQRLMQLAGLTAPSDRHFFSEAARFAARSESLHKLTREENSALEAFVSVLSERETKTR